MSAAAPAGQRPAVEETPDQVRVHEAVEQQARRPLSAGQIRAIYDAMRTFRDDDLTRTSARAELLCDRCHCKRPAAGSLVYGTIRLCNGCATDYELLRASGMEHDIIIFAQEPAAMDAYSGGPGQQ